MHHLICEHLKLPYLLYKLVKLQEVLNDFLDVFEMLYRKHGFHFVLILIIK